MQGNDEASVEVVDSSDAWYRLFSKPNSWMTRRELKELTITQMLTSGTGESFWFCLNAQCQPVAQDEVPTLIIPKSGDQVTEWVVGNQLVGWRTDELMGRPGE